MPPAVLQRYDSYGGPKPLGDVWTLTRGALTLRCELATHVLGWELRVTWGTELARSRVCKTEGEVFDTLEAWKAEAIGRGWA